VNPAGAKPKIQNASVDGWRLTGYSVAFIQGDGVGPEVSKVALAVLEALEDRFGIELRLRSAPAGDVCLRKNGVALPPQSLKIIRDSDACLKGPVGESAADVIVRLRRELGLYANVRPAKALPHVACLAPEADFVIVRENTEDLYTGIEFDVPGGAIAMRLITEAASRRIAEHAFALAETRRRKVVAVHKSNVLRKSDGLFARVCREVWARHRGVSFTEMYVDAAAMNLIRAPNSFDVIVTTNLFGDILSDEAAQIVGGLGLMPSANVGERFALFEPVHGSAPDIAGKGVANPVAMLQATSMLLEWLGQTRRDRKCKSGADAIGRAINRALEEGVNTPDLGGKCKTAQVRDFLVQQIRNSS
jgi:3-isopropylmalate dehydrogenase